MKVNQLATIYNMTDAEYQTTVWNEYIVCHGMELNIEP